MAGHIGIVNTHESISVLADIPTTILQIQSNTSLLLKILEWGVFFKGTSGSARPALVRLVRQSDQGENTYQTVTPTQVNPEIRIISSVLPMAFRSNGYSLTAIGSDEPTETDYDATIYRVNVHPQTGYHYVAPFSNEPLSGQGSAAYVGIQVTIETATDVDAFIKYEE